MNKLTRRQAIAGAIGAAAASALPSAAASINETFITEVQYDIARQAFLIGVWNSEYCIFDYVTGKDDMITNGRAIDEKIEIMQRKFRQHLLHTPRSCK